MAMERRRLLGLAAGALILPAVWAGPAAAQDEKGTVYYMMPTLIDEFQTLSQEAFEAVLPTLGYKVESLDAQNRADTQISQLENVIELDPAAIILNAVDFDAVVPGIEKAREAGIPVLIYDRQIVSTPSDFTSVSGNVDIGRLAADEIGRLLAEKRGDDAGTVLQILGDPGDSYTLDIQKGFEEVMAAKYPNVEILTNAATAWEPTNAADIAENQLLAHPDIDLIFSHAAHLSGAVKAVLESHGKAPGDILLVSSNGAPVGLDMIREGWSAAEVEQPMFAQVWGIAMFLDKIVSGGTVEPGTYDVLGLPSELTIEEWGPNLKIPGAVITSANVDEPKYWGNMAMPTDPVVPVE